LACTVTALGQYGIKSWVAKHYGIADESQGYFRHYFTLMQVGLLPLYSLLSWFFFRKTQYNHAEMLVVVLYSLSILLCGVLLLNCLRFVWPDLETQFIELPIVFIYNTLTYFNLFSGTSRWVLTGKSWLINTACFFISMGAAELAVRFIH
jgi:hypothetical protein